MFKIEKPQGQACFRFSCTSKKEMEQEQMHRDIYWYIYSDFSLV